MRRLFVILAVSATLAAVTISCEKYEIEDVNEYEQLDQHDPLNKVANKPRAKSKASLAKSKLK